MHRTPYRAAISGFVAVLLAACGGDTAAPEASARPASAPASIQPSSAPTVGAVVPAPGSDSAVYAPNPRAIVVAIDPGHGGCLDWGVPDPSQRGVELAEKTLTLGIAQRLREMLEEEGVGVVMMRDGDDALAGDDYEPLGCSGPGWRDVNGDGLAGFGSDLPEATRTRDELQARIDLSNLAQADVLVSIHINSPSEGGRSIEIAFSETFYTDETPWGDATARLAELVQEGVVEQLNTVADYDRRDRGTTAHNFYLVAPPLLEESEDRPNRWAQPTRGALMPTVLAEVGSITLRREHDLLASDEGQRAVARGLFDGIAAHLSVRDLAARVELGDTTALEPDVVAGEGPPFWPAVVSDGPVRLRITNTGTSTWPEGLDLIAGWEATAEPYLAFAPDDLATLDVALPTLGPGESVELSVTLPDPPPGRAVAWISLMTGNETVADLGSPALQLSSEAP